MLKAIAICNLHTMDSSGRLFMKALSLRHMQSMSHASIGCRWGHGGNWTSKALCWAHHALCGPYMYRSSQWWSAFWVRRSSIAAKPLDKSSYGTHVLCLCVRPLLQQSGL